MPRSIYSPEIQGSNLFRARQEPLPLVVPSTPPVQLNSGAFNKRIQFVDGEMQSRDYVPDVSGWRISDTLIEALNIKARGIIEATSGDIGGWTIDSNGIFQGNARLSSTGYISFGNPAPTAYGNNIGAWLGYSSSQARFSLYRDTNNFLQWDGTKILVRTPNFRVLADGSIEATNGTFSGTLTSTNGTIGGFSIGSNILSANNLTIASGGAITLGSGNNIVQLSASNSTARIWVGNTSAGSAPFRVSPSGNLTASNATLTSATVSGTINASAGNFSGNITMSGTFLSGTSGSYFRLQGTNNELRFFNSNTERMRLDSQQLTFWASNGTLTGRWRGELLFGGLPFISTNANIHTEEFLSVKFNTIVQEGVQFSFGNRATFRHMPNTIDNFVFSSIGMGFGGAVGFDVDGFGVAFVDTSGNFVTPSDIRLKENVQDYTHPNILDFFGKLNPVTFNKKNRELIDKRNYRTVLNYDDKVYVGLIAQQVQEIDDMNSLVNETGGYLGVNYDNFIPYIILAIQETTRKHNELETAMELIVDKLQEKGVI